MCFFFLNSAYTNFYDERENIKNVEEYYIIKTTDESFSNHKKLIVVYQIETTQYYDNRTQTRTTLVRNCRIQSGSPMWAGQMPALQTEPPDSVLCYTVVEMFAFSFCDFVVLYFQDIQVELPEAVNTYVRFYKDFFSGKIKDCIFYKDKYPSNHDVVRLDHIYSLHSCTFITFQIQNNNLTVKIQVKCIQIQNATKHKTHLPIKLIGIQSHNRIIYSFTG